MPSEKIDLPPMPKCEVHHATWDNSPGWAQYHDKHDPLPDKWDDAPPDVVEGFFSGDQMRAYALLAVKQERAIREGLSRARPRANGDIGLR